MTLLALQKAAAFESGLPAELATLTLEGWCLLLGSVRTSPARECEEREERLNEKQQRNNKAACQAHL